ncbi:glycosyltransferase family 4 protein [Rhodococcus jostii]|uniref:Glycosyltransferase family 4 protein n=1 Tax=Rhodococcus jostii TaxID=132919 RepID=A0ABU4C9R7_RHOJO|nr:glycosyltransferase family 4 protein [Rhodococcus jostii]MDV6280294.1 glycosyltransferase family 4 protein [Rhodococcus jostii]
MQNSSTVESLGERARKITFIGLNYWPEPTGIAPYTTDMARELARAGHSVKVITGYPHYPSWHIQNGYKGSSITESIDGVEVRRVRQLMLRKPSALGRVILEGSFGLRAVLARWSRPDVVVCVTPSLIATALVMIRAKLARRRPRILVWVQDLYGPGVAETGAMGSRGAQLVSEVEGAVLKRADAIAVIHDRFRAYIHRQLGGPYLDVSVIRNWTHLTAEGQSSRDDARRLLGWSLQRTIVMHAGNMGVKQNLQNIVEVAKILDAQGDARIELFLVGDGNQREEIEKAARGVSSIRFIPPLSDELFRAALVAADVLVVNEHPDLLEMSVPSKLTTYFFAGRPIIAAANKDGATAGEVIRSGAGVVVDPNSPMEFLESLYAIVGDANLMNSMGQAGRAYAAENLSRISAVHAFEQWILGTDGPECSQNISPAIGEPA